MLMIFNYLEGYAKDDLASPFVLGGDDARGFEHWPEAVDFLIQAYAEDSYIEEAVCELDELRKRDGEDETKYARRLNKAACTFAWVYFEQELINRFIRGLRDDVKPLLRLSRVD